MAGESDGRRSKAGALRNAQHVLNTLRSIDPDMTMQQASTLVAIFILLQEESPTIKMVVKSTGLAPSTASRNMRLLGSSALFYGADGKKRRGGLGLVNMYQDTEDYRYKRIKLTPKGEAALATLIR